MRRYLALFVLVCLSIPAGVSISGCIRNPAGNYCNGLGYGTKNTDLYSIDLEPRTTGISMAFGQTRAITPPTAKTCKGTSVTVGTYTYGTTNNQLLDISPTGNMCAGTWNRNSGGGIADYTICNFPNPLPSTGGLPYGSVFISASAQSVTSNPVEVYIHAPVSSIALAQTSTNQYGCYSQNSVAQLDSEACYSGPNNTQYELCAPPSVTQVSTPKYACTNGLAPGITTASIQDCSSTIGTLTYTVGTPSIATINAQTNQITAELPGTTVITASIAGSGSSAGYFSTCPPKSISVTLANGSTSGTVTQGVTQNLTTTVVDTTGATITGLSLDYQSTNPLEITAGGGGSIAPSFPGAASIYAVCQPASCNPSPINQVGLFGTGVSLSSNPVDITTPGTASAYLWFGAPGRSQYIVPVQLLSGTPASTIRLPYVPNSMLMDQTGANIYLGSSHALMVVGTTTNAVSRQDPTVPGVVLAVAPNGQTVLINDQVRQTFYIYNSAGTISATFGGMGAAAAWTPDSKTLYITDSAALGGNHSDALYVYNANTGWTSCTTAQPCAGNFDGATNLALTIPGVGAFFGGPHTVARSWCPAGTVGNYTSMVFYPEGADIVNSSNNQVPSDALAATTDGKHILSAAYVNDGVTFSDISVQIPNSVCPSADSGNTLEPLPIPSTLNPQQILTGISASSVNQVVTSPAAVLQGTAVSPSNLSFITYNPGTAPNGLLPYYTETTGSPAPGTLGYLTLTAPASGPGPTAPVAGAFSSDDTIFFVSTAGDNQIHYVNTLSVFTDPTHADTQQLSPNLPACAVGSDPDCVLTNATEPASGIVPATAIVVKPRSTT
jgi:hypothetical protein